MARLCPPQLGRRHPPARIARVADPGARVTGIQASVTGAAVPGHDVQAEYLAASTRQPSRQAARHACGGRKPIATPYEQQRETLVAARQPMTSPSEQRLVCHRYPQFTTIHGLPASRGYLGEDRSVHCMIFDSTVLGTSRIGSTPEQEVGVRDAIHQQHIWALWRSTPIEDSKQACTTDPSHMEDGKDGYGSR